MPSQAIGVDIGTHAVKIAVLQKRSGLTRAVRLYRAPLAGDMDPVRMQGALKRGEIAGGPALISITGRDLIIRYTHVPPVPDWRLKLLMQFEINEVSGQSGGEVAADYRRLALPVEGDEDTVLVSLARNSWLSPRLEAARSAGIKANGGCPASVALFNAFLTHGAWKEGETTFLVCIGRENIDMAIQQDGELLFARNISGGGHMFTEAIMGTFGLREPKAEKNKVTKGDLTPKAQARYPDATTEKLANAMLGPAGQLISMIQSTVMICRAQTKISDLNIDRLVLTGGTARMKGVQPYFQANMSVPVDLFDAVGELDLSALNEEDKEELGDDPYDFAVAVGLAEGQLQTNAFSLEVLTEKERKKRTFLERTLWALGAAAAALVLVVLLFQSRAGDIGEVQEANERLASIKRDKADIRKRQEQAQADELEARKKELALRARRLPGGLARAVFAAIHAQHPDHIYLERFKLESRRISLDLEGNPTTTRAGGMEEGEVGRRIHDQPTWPEVEVEGVVQKEYTPKPGTTLSEYYTQLGAAISQLRIEGWPVEWVGSQLDKNQRFRMTFRLKKPEEK